ncbi:class F sortase [Streptomyces sp. JNUCC 64]
MTPSLRSTVIGPALLALLAGAALTGCGSEPAPPRDSRPAAAPESTGPTAPGTAGGSSAATVPEEPVRVSVPSLGVSSALMPLGLNRDGTVEVPPADRGMTAGWYTGRPVPGERGPAVIIGHNATRHGPGVFEHLGKIRKGARITVRDAGGKNVHFRVTGRETVRKKAFPTERVYGDTDDRALRLITCDGGFDAEGHPVDNLIVYAVRS